MTGRRALVAALLLVLAGGAERPPQDATPGPRYGHELVYDEARAETVLFGGFASDGQPRGDTWLWNGVAWRESAARGPSPRRWPAAAHDVERGVTVLHGGREGVGRSGRSREDTWLWDGTSWTPVEAPGPSARDHHRAVYDRGRGRIVLFGGWSGSSLLGDTWEWDGRRWERVATAGPSPRAPFGLAYDDRHGRVLLIGGQDLERAYADVWSWDGRAWRRLDTSAPRASGFHALTYDPESGSVLLFGGRDGETLLNDLWAWDGTRWELLAADGPVRRGMHASVWDRARRRLVVHGSGDRVDGAWQLDPRTWSWDAESGWRVVAGGSGEAAPAMIGAGRISLPDSHESPAAFDPLDGGLYFQRADPAFERSRILRDARAIDTPTAVSFAAGSYMAGVALHPGHDRLVLMSGEPTGDPASPDDWNLWTVRRGRTEATPLPSPVNSAASECCPTFAPDGSLLFASDRAGSWDLYRARERAAGEYRVTALGGDLDSPHDAWPSAVSADGRTLLLSSIRPDGHGGDDLWVACVADPERDTWRLHLLPPPVNGPDYEDSGLVDPTGEWLLWSSRRPAAGYRGDANVWRLPLRDAALPECSTFGRDAP